MPEDYIKPLGISARLGDVRINEIVKGERSVSGDTALRLERDFGSVSQDCDVYELAVVGMRATHSHSSVRRAYTPLLSFARHR